MFGSACQSNATDQAGAQVPSYVRAQGRVSARFIRSGRATRLLDCFESGGFRLKLPKVTGPCDGILVNTAGGMAGGDDTRLAFDIGHHARVRLTTQSAEKIYRCEAEPASSTVDLSLAEGASLAWIPQETILFDRAGLQRHLDVEMHATASIIVAEMTILGRIARNERLNGASFRDRWRIRRGGRLVFAEDVKLEGPVADVMSAAATGADARAIATVLYVSPDAEARLASIREVLRHAPSEWGASAWNGLLCTRFVCQSAHDLRRDVGSVLARLMRAPLPRLWLT